MTKQEAEAFASYGFFRQEKTIPGRAYATYVNVHNNMLIFIHLDSEVFSIGYEHGNFTVTSEWYELSKYTLAEQVKELENILGLLKGSHD